MPGSLPPRARHLAGPTFDVRVRPDRAAVRVMAVGELDLATVDRLHATVEELVAAGFEHVVIDLRELVFLDCSGLHLLCALHDRALADDWRLTLIQGPAAVRKLFAMTQTLDVLPFLATAPVARRMRRESAADARARAARRRRRRRSQH